MRLGIRNIEYIPAQNVRDYSSLPAGSSVNFSDFLLSDLKKLPFTPETGDFLENWLDDENGKYSDFTFSASVRRNKEEYRDLLQILLRKRHIFKITLVSGISYIVGSQEYRPKFSYADKVSGISSSEFSFTISLKSLHGVLTCSK